MSDMNFLPTTDFQFDPQIFGGYREPQDNMLSNAFDETFFNDAFNEVDFTTPYFAPSPMPQPQKKDLLAEIDDAKNEDRTELVQTDDGQFLTCNKIWYVNPVIIVCGVRDANSSIGRNCNIAPRSKMANSIWMAFAPTCRRRPSALGLVPWLMRRHSRP